MADHNELRQRLNAANTYRRLLGLKGEIQRSKGQLPFSIYADLLSRTEEKLRTFDFPMCSTAKITILFSNGLDRSLDTDECMKAMSLESTMSNYIFTKYPSASDYMLDMIDLTGTFAREAKTEEAVKKKEDEFVAPPSKSPAGDIQEKVNDLSDRVDKMEKTLTEELPKISRKMTDIEVKMDFLYHKITDDEKKAEEKKKESSRS